MIILMDPFDDELKQRGEKCGVELLSLFDAEVGSWNGLQLAGRSNIMSNLETSTQSPWLLFAIGGI